MSAPLHLCLARNVNAGEHAYIASLTCVGWTQFHVGIEDPFVSKN